MTPQQPPESPVSRRVVVIGAGVLGVTLAHRLAEQREENLSVTLLDRDRPGHGTSNWSLAWLNANGKAPRAYYDLSVHGMAAWRRLAERTDGADWYRPVGNLRWGGDPRASRRLAERVDWLASWGYAAEHVDRRRLARLEPSLEIPDGVTEAAWFPDEGYLLMEPLLTALLRRAASLGTDIRTGEAGHVTAVENTGSGTRVVRTADGGRLEADLVVSCAGRWTPEVTRRAGVACGVPLIDPAPPGSSAPALVVRVGPVPDLPSRVLHTPLVHLRAHGTDQVHLEAGDADVDLHTPDHELDAWATRLLDRARALLPALKHAEVQTRKVCVRPLPPDGLPLVGPTPGPYTLLTHSGATLAAGLAELVTEELVTGRTAPLLSPFRPDRFPLG